MNGAWLPFNYERTESTADPKPISAADAETLVHASPCNSGDL
jgi:hypothetical protein